MLHCKNGFPVGATLQEEVPPGCYGARGVLDGRKREFHWPMQKIVLSVGSNITRIARERCVNMRCGT